MKTPSAQKGVPKPRRNDKKAVRAPEVIRSQPPDTCPHCDKQFVDHLGVVGLCEKVELAKHVLKIIGTASCDPKPIRPKMLKKLVGATLAALCK